MILSLHLQRLQQLQDNDNPGGRRPAANHACLGGVYKRHPAGKASAGAAACGLRPCLPPPDPASPIPDPPKINGPRRRRMHTIPVSRRDARGRQAAEARGPSRHARRVVRLSCLRPCGLLPCVPGTTPPNELRLACDVSTLRRDRDLASPV
ncbi:hypothetical protein SEVIR_9G194337v4 [Setaria viridis]